jgi:hypothetical protein
MMNELNLHPRFSKQKCTEFKYEGISKIESNSASELTSFAGKYNHFELEMKGKERSSTRFGNQRPSSIIDIRHPVHPPKFTFGRLDAGWMWPTSSISTTNY